MHYAGIAEMKTVDIAGSFAPPTNPLEEVAKKFGISVDELERKLAS